MEATRFLRANRVVSIYALAEPVPNALELLDLIRNESLAGDSDSRGPS